VAGGPGRGSAAYALPRRGRRRYTRVVPAALTSAYSARAIAHRWPYWASPFASGGCPPTAARGPGRAQAPLSSGSPGGSGAGDERGEQHENRPSEAGTSETGQPSSSRSASRSSPPSSGINLVEARIITQPGRLLGKDVAAW
jgi:hypothetical protein